MDCRFRWNFRVRVQIGRTLGDITVGVRIVSRNRVEITRVGLVLKLKYIWRIDTKTIAVVPRRWLKLERRRMPVKMFTASCCAPFFLARRCVSAFAPFRYTLNSNSLCSASRGAPLVHSKPIPYGTYSPRLKRRGSTISG